MNPQKLGSIQKKLEAFCAQDLEIKQWAQKVTLSPISERRRKEMPNLVQQQMHMRERGALAEASEKT